MSTGALETVSGSSGRRPPSVTAGGTPTATSIRAGVPAASSFIVFTVGTYDLAAFRVSTFSSLRTDRTPVTERAR